MIGELKYSVRSREIVDLISAMRSGRLTISPYFQRNLVWRDAHRRDFIDTILKGYPFPQIFLARGPLNVDTMEASQAVVDGQQRLSAIRDFAFGKLEVGGKYFKDYTKGEREEFLKYEVAVIDFDLDADDRRLKEIFYRLNRTYYSLSSIEKLATEYSSSEFLLVARVLCGEIQRTQPAVEELDDIEDIDGQIVPQNQFLRDPYIDEEMWNWLLDRSEGPFTDLLRTRPIFTPFEFDRKIPLMFTLNLMCTYLSGYYQRNDKVRKFLDDKANEFSEKEEVMYQINTAAAYIANMGLPHNTMWWSKANFFTLITELTRFPDLYWDSPHIAGERLLEFERCVSPEYSLAAREAVGQKGQREFRASVVREVLRPSSVSSENNNLHLSQD